MDSRLRRSQISHPIVLETDYRMSELTEPRQRLARLRVAPFAFESKWKSHKSDNERADVTGRLCDVRRCTRPRPTTKTCTNENHTRISQGFANFVGRLQGRLIADIWITACTQTTRYAT